MPSTLTIMQVVPALKVGGVERGTVETAIYLKQQGHRPLVVSGGGVLVKQLEAHNIQHIKINVGRKSLLTLAAIFKLKQIFKQHQVDVVHARSRVPAWMSFFALKLMGKKRPKFVTTLHGLHSVSRYSSIMARGDAVIAVSACAKVYLQANFQRYFKQEPQIIYRGIDNGFTHGHQPEINWLQQFSRKLPNVAGQKLVLLPGRLTAVKGVENLLPWLSKAAPTIRLLLTANPTESAYAKRVDKLFAEQGLADRLVWLGIERQMPDLYAAVDLVVSCNNKAESFGRAVLEALSIGTPVVAFALGGVTEVMQQLFPEGLVKPGEQSELTQKINQFLHNKPNVAPHNQFSNQEMFEQILAVYQSFNHQDHASR